MGFENFLSRPKSLCASSTKDKNSKKQYFADLVAYDKIIVELKVLEKLTSREESQLINYLKAAKLQVGLLLNFGSYPKLEYKRIVLQKR